MKVEIKFDIENRGVKSILDIMIEKYVLRYTGSNSISLYNKKNEKKGFLVTESYNGTDVYLKYESVDGKEEYTFTTGKVSGITNVVFIGYFNCFNRLKILNLK